MATKSSKEKVLYCSFCNKSQHEVKKLIAGPSVFICDECVALCNDIIEPTGEQQTRASPSRSIPTPAEIVASLDQHVIGQRLPKEVLAIAIRQHYLRIANSGVVEEGVEIRKGNVLLIGPTGTGKTLLAETLANILEVPFSQLDLTGVTEAGFVGGKVEEAFRKLYYNAGRDIAKAEDGVVCFDEVDKITADQSDGGSQRAFRTSGVQHRLLKIVESGEVEINIGDGALSSGKEMVTLRTKNILFILCGAFDGLLRIIEERMREGSGIGFSATMHSKEDKAQLTKLFHDVTQEDLIKFGLDSHFVGRLPNVVVLDAHSKESLVRILTEPKNALMKQCAKKIALEGATLEVDPDAVEEIAMIAMKGKSGARSLDGVCERIFRTTYFSLPELQKKGKNIVRVHLTAQHVREGRPPELISGNQKLLK